MTARMRAAGVAEADVRFLFEMLYEAAAGRPEHPRPALDAVLSDPKIGCYVEGWGRAGDYGLIAESESGALIGAAWYRLFPEDAHGYSFISPHVPEITIGVSPSARGEGVGTVASPFVVFERDEVSTVAGSPPFDEASEAATAGAKRPT